MHPDFPTEKHMITTKPKKDISNSREAFEWNMIGNYYYPSFKNFVEKAVRNQPNCSKSLTRVLFYIMTPLWFLFAIIGICFPLVCFIVNFRWVMQTGVSIQLILTSVQLLLLGIVVVLWPVWVVQLWIRQTRNRCSFFMEADDVLKIRILEARDRGKGLAAGRNEIVCEVFGMDVGGVIVAFLPEFVLSPQDEECFKMKRL